MMFDLFKKPIPKKKKLIIVDGDCCLNDVWVYEDVLGSSEVYVIKFKSNKKDNPPKVLNKYPEIQLVELVDYRGSKETVDKYIAVLLQKAVSGGYADINIISTDYDMVDISHMIMDVNEPKEHVTINVVMPYASKSKMSLASKHKQNFTTNVYRVKRK